MSPLGAIARQRSQPSQQGIYRGPRGRGRGRGRGYLRGGGGSRSTGYQLSSRNMTLVNTPSSSQSSAPSITSTTPSSPSSSVVSHTYVTQGNRLIRVQSSQKDPTSPEHNSASYPLPVRSIVGYKKVSAVP